MRYTLQAGVHGCRPDPHKIMALKSRTSNSSQELQNPNIFNWGEPFLGAVTQMSCWWPDLSQHCTKLRKLTKKGTPWVWLSEYEEDQGPAVRYSKPGSL